MVGDLTDLAAGGVTHVDLTQPSATPGPEAGPSVPMDVLVQSVVGMVASATRNSTSLDADPDPTAMRVRDLSTRRLASLLATRVNTAAHRRLHELRDRHHGWGPLAR